MKTRNQIAYEESTENHVFLFQWAKIIVTDRDSIEWCDTCEGLFPNHHDCDDGNDPFSDKELVESGWAECVWITERVFATREEGEAYGRAKHYNYENGYRVYCVPASGKIAVILNQLDQVDMVGNGMNNHEIFTTLCRYNIPSQEIERIVNYVIHLENSVDKRPLRSSSTSRLARERIRIGLSQDQLAKAVGLSRNHMSSLESSPEARRRVALKTAVKLSQVLCVPLNELFPETKES